MAQPGPPSSGSPGPPPPTQRGLSRRAGRWHTPASLPAQCPPSGPQRLLWEPPGWGPGEEPQESRPSETPPLNPAQNRSRHVPCPLGTGVGAEFGESLGHKRGEWAPTPWPPPADLASWPQGEWAQCVPRRLCQAAPDKGAFGVPGAGMPACGSMRGRAAPVASSPWLSPGHTAGLHCASTVQLQAPPSPA